MPKVLSGTWTIQYKISYKNELQSVFSWITYPRNKTNMKNLTY